MHPNPEGTLDPQGEVDPNGRQRAERLPPSRAEPWTIVRYVRALGGQYVESRHAAFASHPSHVHTTPTIALLLRGALEVTFASGRRLAVDADRKSVV